jgi:hypothetical protein
MMRWVWLLCTITASASIIVAVPASSNAHAATATSSAAPVPSVANPCPRPDAGQCGAKPGRAFQLRWSAERPLLSTGSIPVAGNYSAS